MSHNVKNKIRKQEYKNFTLNVQVRSSFMKMISLSEWFGNDDI